MTWGWQMLVLVGGVISLVLGTAWAALWYGQLLGLLKGILPLLFIITGIMALYYGIDEMSHPPSHVPLARLPRGHDSTETGPSSRDVYLCRPSWSRR